MLAYKGNDGTPIAHSLGKTPEMIWVKNRDNTDNWNVWHKGLNGGGSNAANYYLRLNTADSEQNATNRFGGSGSLLPTSTTIFSSGVDSYQTNSSYYYYIAMLFASVEGISKVGYFAGSDSANTISLGFTPRFFLLKNINAGEYWPTHDNLRGFDNRIAINNSNAQATTTGWVTPTASGVTLKGNELAINKSGYNYIYYAHA